MRLLAAALAAPLALAALPAAAQTLRISLAAETTTADPHGYAVTPNATLRYSVWQGLVDQAADLSITPALATAWERESDNVWRFTLRPGVKFHNGADFTAEDVVASYCRIINNDGEVAQSYSRLVRPLANVEAVDPMTVRITTKEPNPLLLNDLASLVIIPRSLVPAGTLNFAAGPQCGVTGQWPASTAFNDGSAAIGTGPFRLTTYTRSGTIELTRYDGYWGDKPHWQTVRLTPVTAPGPRLAGLLANDNDIIEAPGTADLARLRQNNALHVTTSPTTRLIFLQLDTARSPSPFVQGGNQPNPLRDARVRQALSLALDRRALFSRTMDEVTIPAAQFLPDGMAGTIPGLPVLPYDPARARALLAEAGFPDGFALTFHATNNRYINDGRLAQAIAQFWQRIGVRVELDTMPSAVFFTRRARREFSVAMGGWSASAAETMLFFQSWLVSTDTNRGLGTSNYGGWSNPDFDGVAQRAFTTMDPAARADLLRQAGRIALDQMPVVPVHFEGASWAMRRTIRYAGRVDETTRATEIRPAN